MARRRRSIGPLDLRAQAILRAVIEEYVTTATPVGSQALVDRYALRVSSATVRNILDFPSAFSPPARLVTLERNYRSTQPILAAANAVIELASERFGERDDGRLRGAVSREVGCAILAGEGSDVHDPPIVLLAHDWHHMLAAEKDALGVDSLNAIPCRDARLEHGRVVTR